MIKAPERKALRCAIYTRKSTEHNLDLEFNSLDAQREACEAYIKSQAHEGWTLVRDRFDDGGLSGASMDRPALQQLLAEIATGSIDIVVVYKVDRLTRSLADFAKLVEIFDQHEVSFVSITQSFNTTSSMGRLTLNVLLSFAQFEREVIGERVRDKIAASKRKGIWVGGPVPLGYRCVDKKLLVVAEEAQAVRTIFSRFLELGSIGALVEDLDRRGIRTKETRGPGGRIRGGIRFGIGPLAYLLKNRFYVGEVFYRGEIHVGEHDAILERDLFDAVQAKLAANAVIRRARLKSSPAILTGRIFDDRGNRMSPTHSNKKGVRYRYYVSHPLLQKRNSEAGNIKRVPAPEVEALVVESIHQHLAKCGAPEDFTVRADRELVERCVEKVIVTPDALNVHLAPGIEPAGTQPLAGAGHLPAVLTLPWTGRSVAAIKGIIHAPGPDAVLKPETREALLTAISKARGWVDDIRLGRVGSFAEIAEREGQCERHARFLAPLAFVSPRLVAAIAAGTIPAALTVTALAKRLEYSWAEQEEALQIRI